MLQNPGIPPGCFYGARLSEFVQVFHVYCPGAWHDRGKSGEAEAAFVERRFVVCRESNLRIDDHEQGYGPAICVR
jgi:hypothetical protein